MRNRHTLSRRRFTLLTGGIVGGVGLSGCLGDDEEADAPTTLTIGMDDGQRLIDPIRHMGSTAAAILNQVFDAPYTYDEEVGFLPELAVDDPEIERDGQRWFFEIHEDARFQNGDPVTVEDIEYSYTQPIIEDRGDASRYAMIEEISEVDNRTAQIDLNNPFVRFQLVLTDYIVPKAVREEYKNDDDEWLDNIVGSGPFELVEWEEGERTVLKATEDYWMGDDAAVQEVVFQEVEEPSTRVTTLQTGESDMIKGVPGDLHETTRELENANLQVIEGIRVNYLAFNCNEGPTADPIVREALDACIDLDAEVEFQVGAMGTRIFADMPPTLTEEWDLPTAEWAEIPHERDINLAQQLLEDAGVDPAYEFKILTWDELHREIGISLRNGIEEAGYTASVSHLEWGTFVSQFNTGSEDDMNVYLLSSAGEPMPNRYLYTRHHSDRWGADNGHYYDSPEMFERIEQADQTPDIDERRELIINIQEEILEQRVHLPMYVTNESWGVSDRVQDFQLHPVPTENPRLRTPTNNVSMTE